MSLLALVLHARWWPGGLRSGGASPGHCWGGLWGWEEAGSLVLPAKQQLRDCVI